MRALALALLLAGLLQACSREKPPAPDAVQPPRPEVAAVGTVVDDAALTDETDGRNWLAYGRTYSEKRFSPLDEINAGNVGDLGVEWYLDLPRTNALVGTPLVVDGVM